MDVPAAAFRQYDIRGIVDAELTPELAHAIGRALATLTRERIGRYARIAVGRDNRPVRGAHSVLDAGRATEGQPTTERA